MDAAKWTMTSDELQQMVREAIQHSAKTVSIRLLQSDVLKNEIPVEREKLEQVLEKIQRRYKAQVRKRGLLFNSLPLYIGGEDPEVARRLADELMDATVMCDTLAEELYQVTDQLAQLRHLHDNHYTSALAMALRKINGSLVKRDKQNSELRDRIASLEAEREYAWNVAKTVEEEARSVHDLVFAASTIGSLDSSFAASHTPPSLERSNSRVEAARKGASRISQASLHMPSSRRSIRSSFSSSRFPSRPASSNVHEDIPPVPPVPLTAVTLQSIQFESRPQAVSSPATSLSETLDEAQATLMDLLGIKSPDLRMSSRRRSASFCSSREDRHNSAIRVRSSSGSLKSTLTRRHSLSALKPSDDPLLKRNSLNNL
jgi:hypothetical protein